MEGEPRKEPSAGKENPVQEPTNEQADVEPRWVLLPGQVDLLAWTSGDPHRADDALDEVVARLMSLAAAEDAEPGESSPDAFERAKTRRREERKRQKSTTHQ